MKKLLCVAVLLLALPSCAWVADQACTGTDKVRDTVREGLEFVPVVGPWSAEITDLAFDLVCALVGAPNAMGVDIAARTGAQLDPTATAEATNESATATEDPGN